MILSQVQKIGHNTLDLVARLGRSGIFLWRVMPTLPGVLLRPGVLIEQLYTAGVKMLLIIIVSGLFVGMVLALQVGDIANKSTISVIVVLSLLRELGPVVVAILFAALVGTKFMADIILTDTGLPKELVAPRLIAGLIAVPLLAVIFSAVGVIGANLVVVSILGLDAGTFWIQAQSNVDLIDDLGNGVIKSLVFGFIVAWIAVFTGYDSNHDAEEMGQAATRTVVYSSIAVLGLDFILTALMFGE